MRKVLSLIPPVGHFPFGLIFPWGTLRASMVSPSHRVSAVVGSGVVVGSAVVVVAKVVQRY